MNAEDESTYLDRGVESANGFLNKLFSSCAEDPKGSVHRAWGISLIFVVVFFVISVIEMINLQALGGSKALVVAVVWTGMTHLLLGVLGTFVLKRFPTSFSVGFLLGVLVILANQNLILFGTFNGYSYGTTSTNKIFAGVGFTLFGILSFFSLLVFHFKGHIVVAPVDAKAFKGGGSRGNDEETTETPPSDYMQYEENAAA